MDRTELPIQTPCAADWTKMTPADGGRFCGDCKKVVRNLSRMSEVDARALLAAPRNEDLCVRYLYDAHGTIFFGPDLVQSTLVPASLLDRAKRAAAAVALPLGLAACSPTSILRADDETSEAHRSDLNEMMGGAPAWEPDASPPGDRDGGADAQARTDGGAEDTDAQPPAGDAGTPEADDGGITPTVDGGSSTPI